MDKDIYLIFCTELGGLVLELDYTLILEKTSEAAIKQFRQAYEDETLSFHVLHYVLTDVA